jgi:glucans biosynthesis protein C
MAFLHYWRMPMLFFISGVGTYFALGKRGTWKYIVERHKRLFVPLVFGILILVAPQVYLERINHYNSYFDFYPHFFEGTYPKGNFSWHHLWFICYLLFFSMLALPFFLYMRSKHGEKVYRFLEKILSIKGGFSFLFIPIFISQLILLPYFPEETHALANDWAYFTYYFIYFIYGFILLSNKKLVLYIFQQRHLHLFLGLLASVMMFIGPSFFTRGDTKDIVWRLSSLIMSWFLPLSILGYAQKYLDVDNKLRKYANEAIYPVYLLHQPIILIIGYQLMNLQLSVLLKAIIMITFSLIAIFSIYIIIRKFNILRFIFGMHWKEKKSVNTEMKMELEKAA